MPDACVCVCVSAFRIARSHLDTAARTAASVQPATTSNFMHTLLNNEHANELSVDEIVGLATELFTAGIDSVHNLLSSHFVLTCSRIYKSYKCYIFEFCYRKIESRSESMAILYTNQSIVVIYRLLTQSASACTTWPVMPTSRLV